MFQLVFLAVLILGTYSLFGLWRNISKSLRGRIALAVFFLFTGTGHFLKTEEMRQMLPSFVPNGREIIYVTGVLEIFGAIGLLIPRVSRLAAWALILFLVLVLPANINAALKHLDFGGHGYGPLYLILRIPFQVFVIAWIYYFGIKLNHRPGNYN